jgi:hypothetical protein
MRRVFVINNRGAPLMPCHPARARQLLRRRRARVARREPFTIQLNDRGDGDTQPMSLRLDPGARTTGMALVAHGPRQGDRVVWAGELEHRSRAIEKRLAERRALRRGRRSRQCRNRPARFNNRRRPQGWLPPSQRSRVEQTHTWARRLIERSPITGMAVETARFDVHACTQGRPLSAVEYQQGTLHGTEVREHLLTRHRHTCAYCSGVSANPVLEVEHVQPRSRGGSNRVANLVIACKSCNEAKGARTAAEWAATLTGRSQRARTRRTNARRIGEGWRPGLPDAAAMNATRYAIGDALKAFGVAVAFASGGRTKYNRQCVGLAKTHWSDAACVGDRGDRACVRAGLRPLVITSTGRGRRQVVKPDRYGFPRSAAGRCKRIAGYQTGDRVRLHQTTGKYRGQYTATIAGVRADGRMDVRTTRGRITASSPDRLQLIQRADGYRYAEGAGCV